jgi:hypothetical protein
LSLSFVQISFLHDISSIIVRVKIKDFNSKSVYDLAALEIPSYLINLPLLVSIGVGRGISSPYEQMRSFSVVDFINKQDRLQAGYRQTTGLLKNSCTGQMTPCPMLKATETTRFLETSQGGLHPSWSQMLAPKMNQSLWLHFVVDSMAIGSFLKFGFELF